MIELREKNVVRANIIQSDITSHLTAEEIQEIDTELSHVPYKSGAAIDALTIVQSKRGWISDESLRAIAHHLEMSAEDLEGVATFYNLIYRQPVGEKVILLCDSVSCWICGADTIKEKISAKLGIDYGETTHDNRYTLIPVPCLGACDRAPVMMVGDDLHRNIDDKIIDSVFGDLNEDNDSNESRLNSGVKNSSVKNSNSNSEEGQS
ncbi:MAG TPA: NADH-quinone oxidoreductase subunit NuoE [Flavobacteriales bacterium]|nr:NADH-quinone oxidoreductase subunit NuoE [Flavobacteriales bacterium]HIO39184.1 NADH-quinone oxidoreductase subunit NuoE [Rhodospirillales bacterium]